LDRPANQITLLLRSWSEGDQGALEELTRLVYDDLHRLARRYMAQERPGHTLQATALVHEAYVRLLESSHPSLHDRAHFFAVCARMMRRILVDWARSRQTSKRRASLPEVALEAATLTHRSSDLIAVDDALTALAAIDPRKSQVVELRFFGGLSWKESAEVLKVSEDTVQRDWKFAKSWLRKELSGEMPAQ